MIILCVTSFAVIKVCNYRTVTYVYRTVYNFKEHGSYGWNISEDGCSEIYTIHEPINSYLRKPKKFVTIFGLNLGLNGGGTNQ